MTTKPRPPLPRSIYVEPTTRCNAVCRQCPRTWLPREDDRDLSYDDFRRIVDQFPVLERVVLHGLGEPLLNEDLPRMIRHLKERGARVLFNSNGILLTRERGRALTDARLDEYRLSIDGATRETYAGVRGVDAFDTVLGNVKAFVEGRRGREASGPAVSLWFTAMRGNLHELPALVDLADRAGIMEIHLQRLVFFEKGLARPEQSLFRRSTPEELALVARCEEACHRRGIAFTASGAATPVESLQRDFGERPWSGCGRPYASTYITAGGSVLSCCFAPFGRRSVGEYVEDRVLGNVIDDPVDAVWHGDRYQSFRRAFESDRPPPHCSQCGLNWSY
jgi:MoaA/NifB/PqqE/SkfB family radical SAM enzyme